MIVVFTSYNNLRRLRKYVVDNDIRIDIWMDFEIRKNENNLNKII